MKLQLDTTARTLAVDDEKGSRSLELYSSEAFAILSRAWIKVGWERKYIYGFSWFGRPIIQLPDDLIRIQELIYKLRPDVIIETGVAHGGSLVFYASLFKALGRGRVIGVDVEIRPHNRQAIEAHELHDLIALVEGNSVNPEIVAQVRRHVGDAKRVLVVLDSNHSRAHVLAELRAYGPLVSQGSYIIATDGLMRDLDDVPRGKPEWKTDNPAAAGAEFLAENRDFVLEQPTPGFNEALVTDPVTHWPDAYLKRVR
ncbi:MAG: cephalosporin hydroxylase family protein [Deltaproteobacteria bacterium]